MVLGLIPARGGSKGIPGKNLVDVGGRPLLDYSLALAEACVELDRVILSTDIPEAIEWARRHYRRIETPFVRPKPLCGPKATQDQVVLHAIDFLERTEGERVETVVLLQPTCPFRNVDEVERAIRRFKTRRLNSLVGVSRVWHHPSDYVYKDAAREGELRFVFRKASWKQRQDYPPVWFITGALYICRVANLRRGGKFLDRQTELFPMSDETMIDIDNPFDLELARGYAARRPKTRD